MAKAGKILSLPMIGFAVLVFSVGGYNALINKVLIFDIIGIVSLAVAAVLKCVVNTS